MQACDQLLNLLQAKHHLNPEWNLVNQMITLSYHSPQLLLPMQETADYVQDPKLSLNIASYAKGRILPDLEGQAPPRDLCCL